MKRIKEKLYKIFLEVHVNREVNALRKAVLKEMNATYGKEVLEIFDQSCRQFIDFKKKQKQTLAYSEKQALESVRLFFSSALSK